MSNTTEPTKEARAQKCDERYGFTTCPTLDVACKCEGCTGALKFAGVNLGNTAAFLTCTECACSYVVDGHGG